MYKRHILVILALLVLAPLLSWLPLSAMAALLLMVAWNMSEAHKVVDLLRHAPKDDIIVMLLCMSLTVLFDMVIAISVGIVLASLLFMRRIARMTRLAPVVVDVPDDVLAVSHTHLDVYKRQAPDRAYPAKTIHVLAAIQVPFYG